MHVVIDSTGMVDLPPSSGGGVEAYVWDVARVVRRAGHQVTLVSNLRPGITTPEGIHVKSSGSFVDRFPLRPMPSAVAHGFGGVFTARATRSVLRQNGGTSTVLHLNEEVSSALLASRYPELPKVFTIHNPPPVGAIRSYGLIERTVRWVNSATSRRLVWSHVDVIIALSSWIKTFLVENDVSPERAVLLPVPIDTDHYVPAEPGIYTNDPYFLYVGRLDARKNVLSLVRAVAAARSKPKLVLVGRGPAMGLIEDTIRRQGLAHRVSILPGVTQTELLGLYRGAYAFCLPSTLEAYPRVVLEAAACGVPAIPPNSFLSSDFRDGGFVKSYDPRSMGDLERTIEDLSADPFQRERLSRNARRYAEASPSYTAFVSGLVKAYELAVSLRSSR